MAESTVDPAEEIARLRGEVEALRRDRERERQEKQALREVARTVGSTLDVDAVLEAIVAQASILGDYGASIFEFEEPASVLRFRGTGSLDAAAASAP